MNLSTNQPPFQKDPIQLGHDIELIKNTFYFSPCILHLCNIIVILTKKLLRKHSNLFLINLSVSDILLILLVYIFESSEPGEHVVDNISACFIGLTYIVSVLSTLAISMDKYISVQFSLRYHNILTRGRVVRSIAAIWVFSAIYSGQ